ncbi:hypothetical protein HYALB_00010267 [Hymenoscyphus albidus]|uniref:Thioesterase domain-containing protein n=1 Tax=Hymenoscyphus albidus TaxID=595503 RepID=A0A9N9Q592_9HELO|nr:hypothetical protein HYALB_00010267 [Hymenoscyphus albidus]
MPLKNRFPLAQVPQEIQAHFNSEPWCTKLFQDHTLQALTGETTSTLMGKTLSTDSTIIAKQIFQKLPEPGSKKEFTEAICLFRLGGDIDGHHNTAHGGFLSVLMDEILGYAIESETPKGKATMTAYLKVDYKKPVRTPGIVLARGVVLKKEGKKLWLKGTIENGEGVPYATGEALFVVVERVKRLPKL